MNVKFVFELSSVKPILNNSHLFLITNNNFLICLNLNNKKIIYSYDINQKIDNKLFKR